MGPMDCTHHDWSTGFGYSWAKEGILSTYGDTPKITQMKACPPRRKHEYEHEHINVYVNIRRLIDRKKGR